MTKYNKNMINKCSAWVEENGLVDFGGASIIDFCKSMGIAESTYHEWKHKKEFSEAINTAKELYLSHMEKDAIYSLRQLVRGYDKPRRRTEFKETPSGQPKIAKQITEDVHYPPNIKAIIFLLTNIAPDRWQMRSTSEQKNEIQMKVDGDAEILNDIPEDVIAEIAEQLQTAIESKARQREQTKLIESADEADIIEELAEAVE